MSTNTPEVSVDGKARVGRLYGAVFMTVVLVCAAFGAAASCLLLITYTLQSIPQQDGTLLKLATKAVFFLLVLIGASFSLWRTRFHTRTALSEIETSTVYTRKGILGLVAVLLLIAFEVAPNLSRYPWAAPDEAHHLIVARNLATHGLYASGDPNSGFRLFDPYDSVGAPVIVPVAGALRLAGIAPLPDAMLSAARFVMVLYYLLLCAALFFLARSVLGPAATLAGILVMTASFGSTYLARTLYGEAPALTFLAIGLILWRRGLVQPGLSRWLPMAGLFFGVSILCKSIFVLTAFAFLGAYAYDLATFRRTRFIHYFAPGLCGLLVIIAWWALQASLQYDVATEAAGALGMYQHNLMFGYRSAGRALAWIFREPLALLGLLCGVILAVPALFRKRYDPPLIVLFLVGAFFAFWWIFFTPGQIPRYVWFSYAIAALFAGALVWNALRDAFNSRRPLLRRAVSVALVLIVLIPAGERVARESTEILTLDEMRDDRELAVLLRNLPQSTRVSTTYWPLARTLNFLASRHVEAIDEIPARIDAGALVIADLMTQPDSVKGHKPAVRIGRYALFAGAP